jgi:hypothetical protein
LARDFHLTRHKRYTIPFPYAQPFSIKDFLGSLLSEEWLLEIAKCIPSKLNTRECQGLQTARFGDVFDGYMNFTHFTQTDSNLEGWTMCDLLHDLLRRQAALQLAFSQPVWDILIPVYFGNLDEEFDSARISAILIQVRNRTTTSKLSLEGDLHRYATLFAHTDDPILYILMDLGTADTGVDVIGLPKALAPLKQYLFGIHVAGVNAKTFGCLANPRLVKACEDLLKEVIQKDGRRNVLRGHDELCRNNVRFNFHSREKRWPPTAHYSERDAAEPSQDASMTGIE